MAAVGHFLLNSKTWVSVETEFKENLGKTEIPKSTKTRKTDGHLENLGELKSENRGNVGVKS